MLKFFSKARPNASLVLTRHLQQKAHPSWTSFFVKKADVHNDQWGVSHMNWEVDHANYHVMRTGAFMYIKYHCVRRPKEDLTTSNILYTGLKVVNFGMIAGCCPYHHHNNLSHSRH
jgi:hypothetical protein